ATTINKAIKLITAKTAEAISSIFLFFLSCKLAVIYLALAATLINKNIINSHKNRPIILGSAQRSEEHTSELQSRFDLVCRLLLEKKKKETMEKRGSTGS